MDHEQRLGTITGPIVLRDEYGLHNLGASVWSGPGNAVSVARHDARFILLVEKQTVFARLREDEFATKSRCVLVCGNGVPGTAFHPLLRRLHDQLQVPFYVLADNDPAGYELFFVTTRGAARGRGAARAECAIPAAAYLGLRAVDYQLLGLGDRVQIELTGRERDRVRRLKAYPWLESDTAWQRELDALLQRGFKVEIEALCSISTSCLAEEYLPERLSASDHLRLSAAGRT